MQLYLNRRLTILMGVLFPGLVAFYLASCSPDKAEGFLIEHITVVSPESEQVKENCFVWIRRGRIVSISSDHPRMVFASDSIFDGAGKFLIPGLIDGHVHLSVIPGMNGRLANAYPALRDSFLTQLPKSYLYHGFTSLVELGDRPGADKVSKAPVHPDIYHCDFPLTQANGYGMTFDNGPERYDDHPNFLWDDKQEADIPRKFKKEDHSPKAIVGRVHQNGGQAVKVKYEDGFGGVFNWPNPTEQTVREIVRESHQKELPVILHANSIKAYEFGLATGVDIFAHGLWHWGERDNSATLPEHIKHVLDKVAAGKTAVMPTLRVTDGERDVLSRNFLEDTLLKFVIPSGLLQWYGTKEGGWYEPELDELYASSRELITRKFGPGRWEDMRMRVIDAYISQHRRTVNYLAKQNALFLFGSDTPSSPSYTNPPGYNGYLEIQALASCGLTLQQLFESLTINNARAFRIDRECGTIEAGKKANLLILSDNPLVTADAYNRIEKVILNGTMHDRDLFKAAKTIL